MRVALALLALAATPVLAATPADVEREILRIDALVRQALQQRDRAALAPHLAAGFIWVHASDGRVDDRDSWLDAAARGLALTGQRAKRTEHGATVTFFPPESPRTALRVLRVRLVDDQRGRESWLRQTQTYVLDTDGAWKLAAGQGVLMYEGPHLDPALHARYAGRYEVGPGRVLALDWDGESLFATWPNGQRGPVFLASPTEEASRTEGAGRLRFRLDEQGRPVEVSLVRGANVLWTAPRRP